MQFFVNPSIPFIKNRQIGFIISGILILISLVSLVIHGGPALGIDFTGGTLIELRFEQSVDVQKIRDVLKEMDLGDSVIQLIGEANQVMIRTPNKQMENEARIGEMIEGKLHEAMPGANFEELRTEFIGPAVGVDLQTDAILAILTSIIGILAYISWRFEFRFAIGAVTALVHDVVITLGIFSVFNKEITISIIAAFLTIIGYSLNDTIVVFDRIRENLRLIRNKDYDEVINLSINHSLSRTIMTSVTTLVVVLFLFFFGGEVIHDFAFALIIGVFVGTYSSIFVASPVLVAWHLTSTANASKKYRRK